ncbi:MAG: dipeptidase [Candidatus Kariarchaeaceae archaeon]
MTWIDTHIDTLWAMEKQNREFHQLSEEGHVDLPRAQEAELLCGFFTGFPSESQYTTEKVLRNWLLMVNNSQNQFQRIHRYSDVIKLLETRNLSPKIVDNNIGIVLHFEGAAGIDSELNRLYIYYDVGLRSMGLTWNETNQFATGQEGDKDRGLTSYGFDLLDAMEGLGILIDVSHLNDKSFWDVANNTNVPIFASHSNVRRIADHPRNLQDDMIAAIADSGGSIGINLCKGFLATDPENANINSAVTMAREIIKLSGPKHLHIGTDLDGCTFPDGVTDIRDIPLVYEKIAQDLEFTTEEINLVKRENVMRLMEKVWK